MKPIRPIIAGAAVTGVMLMAAASVGGTPAEEADLLAPAHIVIASSMSSVHMVVGNLHEPALVEVLGSNDDPGQPGHII